MGPYLGDITSSLVANRSSPASAAGEFFLTKHTKTPLLTDLTRMPIFPSASLQRITCREHNNKQLFLIAEIYMNTHVFPHKKIHKILTLMFFTSRMEFVTVALRPAEEPDSGATRAPEPTAAACRATVFC